MQGLMAYGSDNQEICPVNEGQLGWPSIVRTAPPGQTAHTPQYNVTRNQGYVPYKSTACPTTALYTNYGWHAYGISYGYWNGFSDYGLGPKNATVYDSSISAAYYLLLKKLQLPHLDLGPADTLRNQNKENFTIVQISNARDGGYHFRHAQRCNGAFFDGHCEAFSPGKLAECFSKGNKGYAQTISYYTMSNVSVSMEVPRP